jgi:hypothetical protein
MKKALLFTALFLTTLLTFTVSSHSAKACDRSEIFLDSVIIGAGFTDIFVQMNVGGGLTGSSKGAGSDTRTFAFAFYSSGTINPVTFTNTLIGDSTGGFYPGANFGPNFGANFVIGYVDTGVPFTCITSTAACGNRHTDIKKVSFRIDALPDSLRLLGIEGAGNPFAGCYPDADMLIDFTNLPVEWAGFEAQPEEAGVSLNWSTANETNNDRFEVQRSNDGVTFETIAEVDAAGNSSKLNSYNYFDTNPQNGTNFYQIVQVDLDGKNTASEILSVQFEVESGLFWTAVGPNPVHDALNMSFNSGIAQTLSLQVIDLQGRVVRQLQIDAMQGSNQTRLDLTGEASGFYYLRISGSQEKIDKKILKM